VSRAALITADEHTEAAVLMKACLGASEAVPELSLLFAIPNGGHRSKRAAAKVKAEGAKRAQGYEAVICRGWREAFDTLMDYLASDGPNDEDE